MGIFFFLLIYKLAKKLSEEEVGACEWGAIRGSLRSHKYRNILNLCI